MFFCVAGGEILGEAATDKEFPFPLSRPIPAKAGISAAAKRREIVRLYAFGDSLRLRRIDSCLRRNGKEIPAFAGMAVLLIS
ncbi:MAG: hypothetical protein ACR2QC_11225 [Gammaproteobacteria bacterium]